MFRVGQKVVCINNRNLVYAVAPVLGRIYTIRIIQGKVLKPHRGVGIILDEIVNGLHSNGREYGYYSDRFRPVVERKTDISVFTEMLTRAPLLSELAL
jgi:hypothetical protein